MLNSRFSNRTFARVIRGVAVACALALFAAACAGKDVRPEIDYEGSYKSYLDVLENWTRMDTIYRNFETELIVHATYYSAEFREALRLERARAEKIIPDELARLAGSDREELERSARFLVSTYTPVAKWNNLDKANPSFRLWLVDVNGRKIAPTSIRERKIRLRAELMQYPYVSTWSKAYEVVFPREDAISGETLDLKGGTFTLFAAGMQGEAKMEWAVP
ncbi:hypothetical protein K8I61_07160 [bacterium]|nr:hypothetical protein [bacterium]